MESENPREPSPQETASSEGGKAAPGSSSSPSDYYAAPPPPPGERRGCPKWLLTGCGLGGCLMLILIFVGGAFFLKSGMPRLLDFAFSRVEGELSTLADPEVTIEQKDMLREELSRFREHIREERIPVTDVQPLLRKLQDATGDQRLSSMEFDTLIAELQKMNRTASGGEGSPQAATAADAPDATRSRTDATSTTTAFEETPAP